MIDKTRGAKRQTGARSPAPMRAPVGIRIRRQRLDLGISQADLARRSGISPSYLNLIENSKREVGGALLLRIAEHLGLPVEELSGQSEQKTLQSLQETLGDPALQGLDFSRTDLRDLVARFPEIARALARLHRAHSGAAAEIEAYADRFHSDPLLGQMLHELLNRMAGLRSGVEILAKVEDLAEPDRRRFTATLDREARELGGGMRALAGYFDQAAAPRRAISPVREVEDAFISANNHFPELEELARDLRARLPGEFGEAALAAHLKARHGVTCLPWPESREGPPLSLGGQARMDSEARILWLRASAPVATRRFRICRQIAELAGPEILNSVLARLELTSEAARRLGFGALASYAAGAMMMPYEAFLREAELHAYDADLLSHAHGASFEQTAHRLTTLRRPGAEGAPFGFLRADSTGRLTKRFPLPGLSLPGGGHGCLLWPIYAASGTSGLIRQLAEFPNGARFLLIARSTPKRVAAWREPPMVFSVMLACDVHHADRTVYARGLNLEDSSAYVPVGPSCGLCVRRGCAHRQEEAPLSPL